MHVFRVIARYRPGQANWEYIIWKFQDYSNTQILREINFGHFEAPKTAILTKLNLEFLQTSDNSSKWGRYGLLYCSPFLMAPRSGCQFEIFFVKKAWLDRESIWGHLGGSLAL